MYTHICVDAMLSFSNQTHSKFHSDALTAHRFSNTVA